MRLHSTGVPFSALIDTIANAKWPAVYEANYVLLLILGIIFTMLVLFWLYRFFEIGVRDISFIKSQLRSMGCDLFNDFQLVVIVHDAHYVSPSRKQTQVHVTAGRHRARSKQSTTGIFQETLEVLVEQGTQDLCFELLENGTVLATLDIDVLSIINGGAILIKEFGMESKVAKVSEARLRLTMSRGADVDSEKGILFNARPEKTYNVLLHEPLGKTESLANTKALSQGLHGHLEMCGPSAHQQTFGGNQLTKVYAAILAPPVVKKSTFALYGSKDEHAQGSTSILSYELVKVVTVDADPSRADTFYIDYIDSRKSRERSAFRSLDLPVSAWVETMRKLTKPVREENPGR